MSDEKSFSDLGIGFAPEVTDPFSQITGYEVLTSETESPIIDPSLELRFTADELTLNGDDTPLDFTVIVEQIFQSTENFRESLVFVSKTLFTLKKLYANLFEREEDTKGQMLAYEAERMAFLLSDAPSNPLLVSSGKSAKPPTQKRADSFLKMSDEYNDFVLKLNNIRQAKRKVFLLIEVCNNSLDAMKLIASIEFANETEHEVHFVDLDKMIQTWKRQLAYTA